jgi:hypothetical protein
MHTVYFLLWSFCTLCACVPTLTSLPTSHLLHWPQFSAWGLFWPVELALSVYEPRNKAPEWPAIHDTQELVAKSLGSSALGGLRLRHELHSGPGFAGTTCYLEWPNTPCSFPPLPVPLPSTPTDDSWHHLQINLCTQTLVSRSILRNPSKGNHLYEKKFTI